MEPTIVGELTADGSHIVLIAAGDDAVAIAGVAQQLQFLTPLVQSSTPPGAVVLATSWPAVAQLAHTYGAAWRPQPRLHAWIKRETLRRTQLPAELTAPVPEGLTPRPYQVRGALMIASVGSALITDEPGTGKSVTTILGLKEIGLSGPVVVVAPASVVDPWVEHFRTWAPEWRAVAWRGAPQRRCALAGTADVYVVSYDTARMDAQADRGPHGGRRALLDLCPAAVVVDEHHLIKSPHAARSHAVRRLAKHAGTVIALSGTPITHHPADLWSTLVALNHDAWPSRERWVRRYCLTALSDYGEQILGLNPHYEPEFRTALLGQHRRVAKADVLDQLPPKVYSVRTVEMPAAYRKAYDQMETDMLAELPDGTELSVMSVLAQLTRLSQLASAAADVEVTHELGADGEERTHYHVTLKAPSWKVGALLEVLDERPGEPVVAFAPSRQLMRLAGALAEKAGYHVGYIVGGQTMAERTATIAAFQAGKLDLICATTGAGGVGITLTAARTVVFLQRPWSLVEALQAEDRLHRIGAEKHDSIEVIDIVAANTIDTRVRAVLREKAGQLADLVQDKRIVAELLGGASVKKLRKAS